MKHREMIARLIVAASVILTPAAIKQAYATRGYWAVGGEWLLIPLGLLIAWLWMDVTQTVSEGVGEDEHFFGVVQGETQSQRFIGSSGRQGREHGGSSSKVF